MQEIFTLILILVVIWFVWFLGGGPERYDERQKPLLHDPLYSQQYNPAN